MGFGCAKQSKRQKSFSYTGDIWKIIFYPFSRKYSHKYYFLTLPKSPQITAKRNLYLPQTQVKEKSQFQGEPEEDTSEGPKAFLFTMGKQVARLAYTEKKYKYIELKM